MLRLKFIAAAMLLLTEPALAAQMNALLPSRAAAGPRLHEGGSALAGRPAASSFTTRTGTYVVNIAIAVKSPLAANPPITCSVNLASFVATSTGAATEAFETGSVTAGRSGSAASCRVTIPYAWQIPASGIISQTLSVEYTVGNYAVLSGTPAPALIRNTTQNVGVPYPANGATSTVSVNVVI